MAMVILRQSAVMLLLILLGVLACKTKILDKEGGRQFSNFVLEIVTPILTLTAYANVEYEVRLVKNLLWTFALSIFAHALAIGVSILFIRKKPGRETAIERFSCVYTNCGFIGLPLARALLGDEGVFYCSAFLSVFFVFAWTHGVLLLTGEASWRALLRKMCSPTMWGIALGLLLFFCRIDLPPLLQTAFGFVTDLNTPMGLIAAGVSIAGSRVWGAIKNPRVYWVTAVKLLLVPACLMLFLLPMTFLSMEVRTVVLLLTAAPTAAMCTLQCQKHGRNDAYASHIFSLSTILSLATMPGMTALFSWLGG